MYINTGKVFYFQSNFKMFLKISIFIFQILWIILLIADSLYRNSFIALRYKEMKNIFQITVIINIVSSDTMVRVDGIHLYVKMTCKISYQTNEFHNRALFTLSSILYPYSPSFGSFTRESCIIRITFIRVQKFSSLFP